MAARVAEIAEPPADWLAPRARWDRLLEFDAVPLRERLVAAIIDATDEDVPTLKALAMAEAAGSRGDVIADVRAQVYPHLAAAYSEAAADSYAKVAAVFSAAATKFTAAAKQCNAEADSDAIVGEPDSVRRRWLDAAKHAAELNRLTPILCAAAELCGISTADDTMLLPLVIDATGCHRRRVWEAWKAPGARCGLWVR